MENKDIAEELLNYIYGSNPVAEQHRPLPMDQSLYEMGVLDSFGVVELVSFIESHWNIEILDAEITKEKFGGINKMARLIGEKLAAKLEAEAISTGAG
jgi:acyl carrier protein